MRVYLSVDMEGVAGVSDWAQCRPSGAAAYQLGVSLLAAEVTAFIQGALAAGAEHVLVNDAHGAMANLDPARLPRQASYLSGRHKPRYMMQGLDPTYVLVAFLGYHGSISGPPSVLSHTYNPEVIGEVRLNGRPVGESGVNALVCAGYAVPIGFVSGDDVTLQEAAPYAPQAVRVRTKTSVSRFAAHHLHPLEAREQIAAGASQAVDLARAHRLARPHLDRPVVLEVDVQTADMAEVACWARGCERAGQRTVRIESPDPLAAYDAFVALTYLTRQAGGR